jgi:hypothetical protein
LKAPGTKRLTLTCDAPLSNFAFNFYLRQYIKDYWARLKAECEVVDDSLGEVKDKFTDITMQQGGVNRPISVYRFPRRALTLYPQVCMGIQPDARFPAWSADALPATLYGHITQAIYRKQPVKHCPPYHPPCCRATFVESPVTCHPL